MSIIQRPSVGAIGTFSVSQPYDTIVDNLKEYRVEAIRSIQDMIDGNENPLQTVYLDLGLTESDMKLDIDNNIHIVVLSDSSNKYAYVPENKFLTMPDVTGIRYQEKVLGVNLGLINLDYDLTPLIDDIKSLIQERIGVISNIKTVDASAIMRLPKQDHDNLVSARNALIKVNPGYYYKYKECVSRNELLVQANNKLAKSLSKYLSQDLIEVGYRFSKALNLNNELSTYKLKLHTTIGIENDIATEISINEFCIFDRNTNYLRIIRFDNSSVSFINQTQLNINYDKIGIYALKDVIVLVYKYNNDMNGMVFNKNLELLEIFNVYTGKANTYNILPVQVSDDVLLIGATYSDNADIIKITYNTSIVRETFTINNLSVSNSDLDNDVVFHTVFSTTNGFINYNGSMCKITTNSDFTLFNNGSFFSPINFPLDIVYYISTVKDRFIAISKNPVDGTITIDTLNENHASLVSITDSTLNYDTTSILQTIDRSLVFAINDTDSSLMLKMYT